MEQTAPMSCTHLNRTPSTRAGREHCDDCGQLFDSGLPVAPSAVGIQELPDEFPAPEKKSKKTTTAIVKDTAINGEVVEPNATLESLPHGLANIYLTTIPTHSRLSKMDDATVINLAILHGKTFAAYLVEAVKRFDNRGNPDLEIEGFKGRKDFLERGMGINIRKAQRLIEEHCFPEHVAAMKALRREKAEEAKQLKAAEGDAQREAERQSLRDAYEAAHPINSTRANPDIPADGSDASADEGDRIDAANQAARRSEAAKKANANRQPSGHDIMMGRRETLTPYEIFVAGVKYGAENGLAGFETEWKRLTKLNTVVTAEKEEALAAVAGD